RRRRRDTPRLIVLCDVSDSVRAASLFMLEFVHAAQELFSGTRSFVFVSELAETTALFDDGADRALAAIASGAVVGLTASSHYGRAFTELERVLHGHVDRRDTIVVLGDGRTNRMADGADVVARLRDRAGALYWLCPEPASTWGAFDSAMPRFAAASTRVLPARTALELERAARHIVRSAGSVRAA
ncbi:MAG TPA: VWA domain-containing protein, partial [Polyangiaceae bacterium]|nr:VWA domain-containing protein [Polyangiaceae bacterium]